MNTAVVVVFLSLAACTHASGTDLGMTPSSIGSRSTTNADTGGQTSSPTPSSSRSTGPTAAAADRSLPPAYLAWQHNGFAPGLATKLAGLRGVERAVVVAGDTTWMTRSANSVGHTVDSPAAPYMIPIETQAVDAGAFAPFVPTSSRAAIVHALRRGLGVLGKTSARLRRLGVGSRMTFAAGVSVPIGAVVPDVALNWAELLVSRDTGGRVGVVHDRFALVSYHGWPSDAAVARQIRPLVDPSVPLRIQGPGQPEFRRYADSVWPPVLMKIGFGEFAARPDPAHPGYLLMDPSFVHHHLATETVPLLGSVTCNTVVFAALDSAMQELKKRGLASLIQGFAGCYSPRTVMRVPTAPLSHHAWGAAVDINAAQNPFGARPDQDPRLVEVMQSWGFTWGGLWALPDGMHFEYRVPGVGA